MSHLSDDDDDLVEDASLDPYEKIWYRHLGYCDRCADEDANRCIVGECIFQEMVRRLKEIAEK